MTMHAIASRDPVVALRCFLQAESGTRVAALRRRAHGTRRGLSSAIESIRHPFLFRHPQQT